MTGLSIVFVLFVVAILVALYQKITNAYYTSTKRLDNKTVIVTGGTAGMGLHIARDLAKRGARVIVGSPFQEEGENAVKHINNTGSNNVVFKLLDLASLDSVRKFAADILKSEDRLDILINNAGIGIPADFKTADGMSMTMQVNYFGHFLLTILLLPLLKKTGKPSEPSRIVNTSSCLHYLGIIGLYNLYKLQTTYYSGIQTYCKSKLCLAAFSVELSRRLKGSNVVVNSIDPGYVGTRIYDKFRGVGYILTYVASLFFKTPWQGAQTALHVALDTKAGIVSGEFFKNCKISRAWYVVYCKDFGQYLWKESVKAVNLTKEDLEISM